MIPRAAAAYAPRRPAWAVMQSKKRSDVMSATETILQMQGITKTFGPVKALTDVNMSVDRGEIPAI